MRLHRVTKGADTANLSPASESSGMSLVELLLAHLGGSHHHPQPWASPPRCTSGLRSTVRSICTLKTVPQDSLTVRQLSSLAEKGEYRLGSTALLGSADLVRISLQSHDRSTSSLRPFRAASVPSHPKVLALPSLSSMNPAVHSSLPSLIPDSPSSPTTTPCRKTRVSLGRLLRLPTT